MSSVERSDDGALRLFVGVRVAGGHMHVPVAREISHRRRAAAGQERLRHEVVAEVVDASLGSPSCQQALERVKQARLAQTFPRAFSATGSVSRCGFCRLREHVVEATGQRHLRSCPDFGVSFCPW